METLHSSGRIGVSMVENPGQQPPGMLAWVENLKGPGSLHYLELNLGGRIDIHFPTNNSPIMSVANIPEKDIKDGAREGSRVVVYLLSSSSNKPYYVQKIDSQSPDWAAYFPNHGRRPSLWVTHHNLVYGPHCNAALLEFNPKSINSYFLTIYAGTNVRLLSMDGPETISLNHIYPGKPGSVRPSSSISINEGAIVKNTSLPDCSAFSFHIGGVDILKLFYQKIDPSDMDKHNSPFTNYGSRRLFFPWSASEIGSTPDQSLTDSSKTDKAVMFFAQALGLKPEDIVTSSDSITFIIPNENKTAGYFRNKNDKDIEINIGSPEATGSIKLYESKKNKRKGEFRINIKNGQKTIYLQFKTRTNPSVDYLELIMDPSVDKSILTQIADIFHHMSKG